MKWDKAHDDLKQLLSPSDQTVVHASKRVNKFKKRFFVKTQNLLTGETAASPEDIEVILIQHKDVILLEFLIIPLSL